MKTIPVDKDYDEVARHRAVSIGGVPYRCHVGHFSKDAAENEAKTFQAEGIKDVKILECKAYFVCCPDGALKRLTKEGVKSTAVKVIRDATQTVHDVSGDLLHRNEAGEQAVRKLMGWDKAKRRF